MIDGGAGRVICAIPALEHYVKTHPDENIKIFVYGWDSLFWSNKLLQPLTFSASDKGLYNTHFKHADEIVSPEPYRLSQYINQKVSLAEAFDIIINGENNNLDVPRLYLSQAEKYSARKTISESKNNSEKRKTIIIQPFGSSAHFESIDGNDSVVDLSNRSMSLLMYSKIVKELSEKYSVFLFADQKFHFKEDVFSYKINGDLRAYSALISEADYFIGCDSVGQHMARAFDKPGTVIFGSTFPKSVSYPDWFNIVDDHGENRVYSPLRLSDIDCHLADRMNEKCMDYSNEEVDDLIRSIVKHIENI